MARSIEKKACFIVLLVLSVCSIAAAKDKATIRVKGSNDMAGYVDALAKMYMGDHPDVNVVVSGGGTTSGIDGIFAKTVEVAMASLPLTEIQKNSAKNRGLPIQERFFGWQGIAVFVHPDSQVSTLTLEEVGKIFTGESGSWRDVASPDKPPVVYIGEYPFADAYKYFQDHVLKGASFKNDAAALRYYRNIVKAVAADRRGIGLAPLAKVKIMSGEHRVKMIGLKKNKDAPPVFPNDVSVEDRSYPLIRPLYLYIEANSDKKFVEDFVEYCAVYGLAGRTRLQE